MFNSIANNQNPNSYASRFRKKRFAFFLSLVSRLDPPVTILDVGGTEAFWKLMGLDLNQGAKITILNLNEQATSIPSIESVIGDARNLQFQNNSFDVVFSNSVIEHVGDFDDQNKMAEEIRRVGKRYFVQTPNRYFFIEPHFLFPFFQFLPKDLRNWLLMHIRLGWFDKQSDPECARIIVDSIQLLSRKDVLALFPKCNMFEEKFFGATKSFVAYSGWD